MGLGQPRNNLSSGQVPASLLLACQTPTAQPATLSPSLAPAGLLRVSCPPACSQGPSLHPAACLLPSASLKAWGKFCNNNFTNAPESLYEMK
ncbi:hypothetical protein DSO57_1005528 [Entomophthora muscae]|uniref:Uncharacterized protein n=1 Tax=Entomophthora muscae TaxID=34485 RepID=A0ACC2SXA1_9FUNG|nr:hypothetical protein DSO57_1005528 [Entomophthora muscae]